MLTVLIGFDTNDAVCLTVLILRYAYLLVVLKGGFRLNTKVTEYHYSYYNYNLEQLNILYLKEPLFYFFVISSKQ